MIKFETPRNLFFLILLVKYELVKVKKPVNKPINAITMDTELKLISYKSVMNRGKYE